MACGEGRAEGLKLTVKEWARRFLQMNEIKKIVSVLFAGFYNKKCRSL